MVTKNDQQGIVENSPKPSSEPYENASSSDGSEHFEGKSDKTYQEHFPQAAAQRADYELTADARRIQAQRTQQLDAQKKAELNDDPVPSGESDNPHEGEEDPTVKHSDNEPPVNPDDENNGAA